MDQSQLSHTALKDIGNKHFAASQFNKALDCYTKAIVKQPSISTYYTNRALCYFRIQEWDKVIEDCRQALEQDAMNIKAYYFMGQAYMEMEMYDEALPRLFRAHELSLELRRNFGDDITATIRSAKRKKFEALDEKRRQAEVELQSYLEKLVRQDFERPTPMSTDAAVPEDEGEYQPDIQRRLQQVGEMFSQVDERRQKREIPDYLCGRISFELMRDPVITPSGITYERKAIVEHLHRVGHFDPITRQNLTEDKLVPNIVMKEVINTFLEENPWAEDF